ncbi:sserine/threonine protein kinase with PASTA sensor domain [Nitzschia inconspicua]|uniref:Serine/threonine-protein kinase PLK n=1 Tax=Nitzschia inconspicua TaxID=303405 RepID=A0A9K3KTF4_9STRA|nr:sserine/threonine protein kinase with PASTA sensor domain [Nitzschia inconspicua]
MNNGGASGKLFSSSSSGRHPLQSRNPNTIGTHGSFSNNSSTEEYNSKDMAALNRLSNLESSQNENNRRLQNSGNSHINNRSSSQNLSRNHSGHVRLCGSANELREGSELNLPQVPRPNVTKRSNSLPSTSPADEDSVVIEEKRRRVNGEGYTLHRYLRGRLLGKGGFAKVYLCTALDTNKAYAIKIVPKANLTKARARQKLQAEIKIHRTLKHKNVCEYKHFFEDRENCYILLELCHNQSMNEMIKRRKRLTEPEVRYFMNQLLESVKYLHDQLVIHRDLKLGNLFLDKNLNIKVGDLGLATKLESADEKRKTICGTPNYIAPEVIQGDRATRGHSFEVDIWSMGVIMFTCLVGKPPYEAKDVKATYQRILANEYKFPIDVPISNDAKDLIYCMLQSKPSDRPTLKEIGYHPFFTANSIPVALPSNATHVAPKTDFMDSTSSVSSGYSSKMSSSRPALPKSNSSRRPFGARDANVDMHAQRNEEKTEKKMAPVEAAPEPKCAPNPIMDMQGAVKNAWSAVVNAATATTSTPQSTASRGFQVFDESESRVVKQQQDLVARTSKLDIQSPRDYPTTPMTTAESDALTLNNMVDRISTVLDVVSRRSYSNISPDSPSLAAFTSGGPNKWVSRYVDYTSKYGLGYLLNDGSSGVYFNDSSKTVLEAKGDHFQYIERKKADGESPRRCEPVVASHTLTLYPDSLNKKVTLLKHFRNYLLEQQQKSEDTNEFFDSFSREFSTGQEMVYLKKWVRTKHAIFFRLSDQTVQIVFYDHTEILLTPDERHITYVDKSKSRSTYYLTDELVGCKEDIAKRLRYTKEILQQLVSGTKR